MPIKKPFTAVQSKTKDEKKERKKDGQKAETHETNFCKIEGTVLLADYTCRFQENKNVLSTPVEMNSSYSLFFLRKNI